MRATLMYWAARSVGINARVYVGSWQDWQRDSAKSDRQASSSVCSFCPPVDLLS